MTWLELRPNAIPPELRALAWVLWRAEPRGNDKPAKVPYQIADPMVRASSTDQRTWGTFADAVEAYSALADLPAHPGRGPVAGIGVLLTRAAGITCMDLDHVISPDGQLDDHVISPDGQLDDHVISPDGQLDPRAETIVERCDSWTEVSPSGTGLHVFVRGTVARALKGPQIEVYSEARYIAVTGHRWPGTPERLSLQQSYLDRLVMLDDEGRAPRRAYTGPSGPPPDDLAGALLAKLQAWGVPVARLKPWSGGFLIELVACPWADEHTTGRGGAAVMIRASGAFDFMCQHAHCSRRDWRDFRAVMEATRR